MDSETAVNHAWTLYHQLLDMFLHLWDVYENDFRKITMQDPYAHSPSLEDLPIPRHPDGKISR